MTAFPAQASGAVDAERPPEPVGRESIPPPSGEVVDTLSAASLMAEVETLRTENEELAWRLRVCETHGGTPYNVFLASPEGKSIPNAFHTEIEDLLSYVPVYLLEGEATYLYENWPNWEREHEELSKTVPWEQRLGEKPKLKAITFLGPERVLNALSDSQLANLWSHYDSEQLGVVFEPCCPDRFAELSTRFGDL